MIDWLQISAPFHPMSGPVGEKNFHLEIDCECLIDYYSFHDAPSTIDTYCTREELTQLRDEINEALAKKVTK